MYKVFIKNNAILFKKGVEKTPSLVQTYGPILKTSQFNTFSEELNQLNNVLVVSSGHPKKMFQQFFKNFSFIEAAGGIVKSLESPSHYLFIERLGKWDIPKGKLNKGEHPEIGAKREIFEECNLSQIHKVADFPCTYHAYFLYNKYVVKKTHWFLFEGSIQQELIPQLEEDITAVKWFKKSDFADIKTNTYNSLLDLITKVESDF